MSRPEDLSKLPADPAYWAELEGRVLASVRSGARAPDWSEPEWYAPLMRRSGALAALAAAAAIAVSFVPRASTPPAHAATVPSPSLGAPAPIGAEPIDALLRGAEPPALAELLVAPVRGSRP